MVHHVEGKQIGILSMTYDHTEPGVVTSLLNVQHEFANITAAMHVHISHDECMEVLVLHGDEKDLKAINERVMALKDIKNVKLTTIKPG